MAPALAIATLPIYYCLVLYPTFVAAIMVVGKDAKAYNNVSPRAGGNAAAYRKLLGPPAYEKYERCKAANAQGYEVFQLVAAALVVGVQAGLDDAFLNNVGIALVAMRLVYTEVYMRAETREVSYIRSVAYNAQVGTCFWVLGAAAWKYHQEA